MKRQIVTRFATFEAVFYARLRRARRFVILLPKSHKMGAWGIFGESLNTFLFQDLYAFTGSLWMKQIFV